MAYITADRKQSVLFPPSLDDYVPPTDPVHAYDTFLDQIDLNDIGIIIDNNQIGPPEFHPRLMLKLLVYGYSYGIRSSRKLERALHHNLSFIWLLGDLKPDHKTIARFRRTHREALSNVLKQCVRLCLKLNLIEGNTFFVDGTKIKANASVDHAWNEKRCQDLLKHADQRIEQILKDIEEIDQQEEHQESLVQMKKDLHNKQTLKERVSTILVQLKKENRDALNTTDLDCAKVKDKQSFVAGYNVQNVIDDQQGLIVHNDVVPEANDSEQFSTQVIQANNNIGGTCSTACADAGYANTQIQKEVDDQNILVVVPSQRQALKEPPGPFSKDKFLYDSTRDCYICPQGEILNYVHQDKVARRYQVRSGACSTCVHLGRCTSSPHGRIIGRLHLETQKEKFEKQYQQNRHIFQRRKEKAEHPFGHIKRNLGVQSFLLRGLKGVKAEAGLLAVAFNLTRIINILGVAGLMLKLDDLQKPSSWACAPT